MIISPSPAATSIDPSVHRALWALLPAPVQRGVAVLRPLAATEVPAPASRRALTVAGLFLLGLAVAQQWVLLGLLLAALAGLAPCRRALAARAQRIAAAQQKVKQDELDERALAERVEAASAAALVASVVALAEAVIIIVMIMSALSFVIAAFCKSKTKSINHNLIQRIFGQQLAGAAIK